MLRAAIVALVLSLSATALADQPLTFWWYAGDKALMPQALDCALSRIKKASGLPLDVSYYAAHWVRQYPQADMPSSWSGWTLGSWDAARIRLGDDLTTVNTMCQVLVHEVFHVLRRTNEHGGPVCSMTSPTTCMSSSRITAEDLTALCSVQACTSFTPES